MDKQQQAIDAAAATASKTAYVGSGGAVIGGLSANEIGVYGGLVVAVLGWLTSVYFKYKAHKLLEHHLKKEQELEDVFSEVTEQ